MAKYGINQKGNRTLLDRDNYSYNLEKKVNGTEFWRCSKFKKGCKSRAISRPSSNNILNVTIHDHSNNLINSEARKAEKEAIRLAGQNPSVAPRRILGDLTSNLLENSPTVINCNGLRSSQSSRRAVQRERNKVNPQPPVPKSWKETLEIPDNLAQAKVRN